MLRCRSVRPAPGQVVGHSENSPQRPCRNGPVPLEPLSTKEVGPDTPFQHIRPGPGCGPTAREHGYLARRFQQYRIAVELQKPLLAGGKRADLHDLFRLGFPCVRAMADERPGTRSNVPLFSNPMNPRSKRWSMDGVRSRPFSPLIGSSLLESRQGLQGSAHARSTRE